ncbi:hypothetical protein EJ03DRAFT_331813 [Teratosphaeria nubilosa]|uniref:Uncharacterized protein n=1 Tax=Teratosphaeria nubilosa TaxID=161662 RepID=A0A6G1KV41_9PEZI|nr:hypothetical protein EJ03DRAFT_331813 [Teratosphaeria nubilosa]
MHYHHRLLLIQLAALMGTAFAQCKTDLGEFRVTCSSNERYVISCDANNVGTIQTDCDQLGDCKCRKLSLGKLPVGAEYYYPETGAGCY